MRAVMVSEWVCGVGGRARVCACVFMPRAGLCVLLWSVSGVCGVGGRARVCACVFMPVCTRPKPWHDGRSPCECSRCWLAVCACGRVRVHACICTYAGECVCLWEGVARHCVPPQDSTTQQLNRTVLPTSSDRATGEHWQRAEKSNTVNGIIAFCGFWDVMRISMVTWWLAGGS